MSGEIRLQNSITENYYTTSVGENVLIRYIDHDVVMTTKAIAQLYGVERSTVSKALKGIFKRKELNKKAVCEILGYTAKDGKIYQTTYYNQDAIIAVGLKFHSDEAKAFQSWLAAKR